MSEKDTPISQQILAQLEGEKIRIILRDGSALEGTVRRVDQQTLRLGEHSVSLKDIVTYFLLKGS